MGMEKCNYAMEGNILEIGTKIGRVDSEASIGKILLEYILECGKRISLMVMENCLLAMQP